MSEPDTKPLSAPQRHRTELLPLLTSAFAQWGYRKATTAKLAERCGVQEAELYRVWPTKLDMFLAAIDHVFDEVQADWSRLLSDDQAAQAPPAESIAQRLLSHQSLHHGDRGFYRIIFAGLSELDDKQVHKALSRLYRRFHGFVSQEIKEHRASMGADVDAKAVRRDAWGLVGVAAMCDIGRSLGMLSRKQRHEIMSDVGSRLLEGR